MMSRKHFSLILVPALALAACGRAESGDASYEAPRPVQSGAPAEQVGEPGPDGQVGAGAEVGSLPGAEAPGVEPAAPGGSTAPAVPGTPAAPAAPASPASPVAPGAAAPAPQQPAANSAEAILERVDRTYSTVRSFEADFVQHLTVPLLGTSQRSEGRLAQRRPDRFVMRFTDPAGDIMVADGRHFWLYTPSVDRTQVLRSRLTEGASQVDLQQQFLSNPTQRFNATLVGTETVNGRATHVLTLVPRQRSQYRMIRVWVDQQDNLVRRFEMTEENESVRRIELRNLRLNVDLPDSHFQFTPPAGTQVFDQ